jgi:hypothetical protein
LVAALFDDDVLVESDGETSCSWTRVSIK